MQAETKLWNEWEFVSAIAQYLGCAEDVPLSQWLAGLEARMAKLETKVRGHKR